MAEKFNIFGISGDKNYTLEDLFEVRYDEDDTFFAETKETFSYDFEDDDLKFKYKFVIEADYCEGNVFYALQLVPTPESLCKSKLEDVISCSGIEEDEADIYDVCSYGASILFASTKTEGEEIKHDVIDAIANTLDVFNRIWFGYSLDKYQNAINTGWDLLNDYIKGIDAFKVAMDRFDKEKC